MIVKKGNAEKLYAALVEQEKKHHRQEDEFTAKEFATDAGLSESTARKRLLQLVKEGVLESRIATLEGFNARLFKFIKS